MDSSTLNPLPNVVDFHGRRCDPITGAPLADGQEAPGSIFHAPPESCSSSRVVIRNETLISASQTPGQGAYQGTGTKTLIFLGNKLNDGTTISFSQLMEQGRRQGMEPENVFTMVTPKPEDLDRTPSPPPKFVNHTNGDVEMSFATFYSTQCAYCWAIVQGKERANGFKLSEICQAVADGCSTCEVLWQGIVKFADLLFPKYSYEKVRIRQGENGSSKLLSATKNVTVCFDEYGGETIGLTFDGSSKFYKTFGL